MVTDRPPFRYLCWGFVAALTALPLAPAGPDQPGPAPAPATDPPGKSVPLLGEPSPESTRLLAAARQAEEDRERTGAAILKRLQTQPLIPERWMYSGHRANTTGLLALAGGAVEKQYLTPVEWEDLVLALGNLRYEPAVGLMIEHITKRRVTRKPGDRSMTFGSSAPHLMFPTIRALWGVGYPAVKPLLQTYLPRKAAAIKKGEGEKDHDRTLWLIEFTLSHHSMAGEAILQLEARLARNRMFTNDDDEFQAISSLLEEIQREQRQRR